jgi:hypothetical protein
MRASAEAVVVMTVGLSASRTALSAASVTLLNPGDRFVETAQCRQVRGIAEVGGRRVRVDVERTPIRPFCRRPVPIEQQPYVTERDVRSVQFRVQRDGMEGGIPCHRHHIAWRTVVGVDRRVRLRERGMNARVVRIDRTANIVRVGRTDAADSSRERNVAKPTNDRASITAAMVASARLFRDRTARCVASGPGLI